LEVAPPAPRVEGVCLSLWRPPLGGARRPPPPRGTSGAAWWCGRSRPPPWTGCAPPGLPTPRGSLTHRGQAHRNGRISRNCCLRQEAASLAIPPNLRCLVSLHLKRLLWVQRGAKIEGLQRPPIQPFSVPPIERGPPDPAAFAVVATPRPLPPAQTLFSHCCREDWVTTARIGGEDQKFVGLIFCVAKIRKKPCP